MAAQATLAAAIGSSALGIKAAIALSLGGGVALVLNLWRRRLGAGKDPLRSLTPPAGELRLARELEVNLRND